MDDQNVERVAVFRLGRRNEAPVVRISQAGHQRFGKREHAQLRIEVQLAGTAVRGLDDGVDGRQARPRSRRDVWAGLEMPDWSIWPHQRFRLGGVDAGRLEAAAHP